MEKHSNNHSSEPNAQNSELDPKTHPSGYHIEQMYKNAERAAEMPTTGGDQGLDDMPSARPGNSYESPQEPAEGSRLDQSVNVPHRHDADHRENR